MLANRLVLSPTVRVFSSRWASTSTANLVPLTSFRSEDLGSSILFKRSNLPPGSAKTPHDLLSTGVFAAKVLSLSSSAVGAAMVPVLSSYLWEAASERPSMMAFAVVANSFLALLSFTPFLLHFLTKRFVLDLHYNEHDGVFTSVHYNMFLQRRALRFRAEEVVDAAISPQMKKLWLPLATVFVHNRPLLLSLDRNSYVNQKAFELLTKNVTIPLNHD